MNWQSAVAIIVLTLTACTSPIPPVPTQTAIPTATRTPEPTGTATATPLPTPTEIPANELPFVWIEALYTAIQRVEDEATIATRACQSTRFVKYGDCVVSANFCPGENECTNALALMLEEPLTRDGTDDYVSRETVWLGDEYVMFMMGLPLFNKIGYTENDFIRFGCFVGDPNPKESFLTPFGTIMITDKIVDLLFEFEWNLIRLNPHNLGENC